jgi:sugar/nucleoside kinase (ribokinase family)
VALRTLVVGGIGLDDIETPSGRAENLVGGSAWYFAIAASFFSRVMMVGAIGTDFPRDEISRMRSRDIDLLGLRELPGRSFRWAGRYHEDLNVRDTVRLELNVFADFEPTLPPGYADAELVFLANIHPKLQMSVLDQLRQPRLVVCDTLPHWIATALPELRTLLGRVDVLTVNEEEARLIAEEKNLIRAARRLIELGPHTVLVKRGEYGVLAFSSDGVFSIPAYPLEEVVDPTGAGDSFAGGLLGSLASSGEFSKRSLRRAIAQGSVMASFAVEDFGTRRLETLRPEEVRARFAEFSSLTRFAGVA